MGDAETPEMTTVSVTREKPEKDPLTKARFELDAKVATLCSAATANAEGRDAIRERAIEFDLAMIRFEGAVKELKLAAKQARVPKAKEAKP